MSPLVIFAVAAVIGIHPGGNPQARKLTVEDFTADASLTRPERVSLWWDSNSELTKKRPSAGKPSWVLPSAPGVTFGQSVSRNEFGCETGVFPAPDGKRLAVYRKDESAVGVFPLPDLSDGTDFLKLILYPMNGTPSEKLAVCICDYAGNILTELKADDFDDERYLTNVSWSPDSKYVFVQVLDRSQHHMRLNMYRADNGSFVRTILSEDNDAWVEPEDPVIFIKDSYRFIYRTDNRDGWRNLYLCDTLGQVRRITECNADVKYVANDGKWIYYTSAEVSPVENHLFRISVNAKSGKTGKPIRLTPERGWHEIDMAPDCSRFIDRYSELNTPGVTLVKRADGLILDRILNAIDPLGEFAQCEVELGTVASADGQFENYYRFIKPLGYDPSKKYPLIVYVYGGPHSQMVTNSWLGNIRMWEMLMAQKGYAVYVQDNRGTSNRGAAFEKAINRQCGQAEMADQMEGLSTILARNPWIDRERIGVHGWSYGGFMTLSLATNNPSVFKVAVAGGPVIDWRWYEVMYGERYMDNPETNQEGFEKTSLIPMAGKLRARTLICQGAIDDTVVWRHSVSFAQACIDNDVPLDYFPYPVDKHNMVGKAKVHLYKKITDYFLSYL